MITIVLLIRYFQTERRRNGKGPYYPLRFIKKDVGYYDEKSHQRPIKTIMAGTIFSRLFRV